MGDVDFITNVWNGQRFEKRVEGRMLPFKDGVRLFNSKRRWWLCYSQTMHTGAFKSKRACVAWYEGGGR